MPLSQLFGRIIHPHPRVKLTPDQEKEQRQKRLKDLQDSGVWLGFELH